MYMTGSSAEIINLGSRGETGSLSIMGSGSKQLFKSHNSLSASKPNYRGTLGRANINEMQMIPEDGDAPASTMQVQQTKYMAPTAKNL